MHSTFARAQHILSMLALAFVTTWAQADKAYGPGVTDTEIKIGQTMPYSGPISIYGMIGKAEMAYMAKINAQGGINGRRIRLISLDDGYSPPVTVEQVRKLVEQEHVLLLFNSVGTATNMAIRKYMNANKVPQLFVAGGDSGWGDYKHYPWTIGWGASYQTEGRLYAAHILKNRPNAKVALFYLNDDYGRDYVSGFRDGLGESAAKMIVAEQTYEYADPTVDSQMVSLQASGADTLFSAMAGRHASQAIRKIHELGWNPRHYTGVASTSPEGVLKPAGMDNAVGLLSAYYGKDPSNPQWRDDPAIRDYLAFMKQYMPGENPNEGIYAYGYQVAQVLEYVLRQCGDDLTRENVMRQATNMKLVAFPMLLPGITANTSPTDYFPVKQMQMFRFNGKEWLPIGDIPKL